MQGEEGMKRIKEQAEVIIRLDYQEQIAHICVSAWPKMAGKMEKLYGPGNDRDTEDCARRWAVPLRAISFRRPKAASHGKARDKAVIEAAAAA